MTYTSIPESYGVDDRYFDHQDFFQLAQHARFDNRQSKHLPLIEKLKQDDHTDVLTTLASKKVDFSKVNGQGLLGWMLQHAPDDPFKFLHAGCDYNGKTPMHHAITARNHDFVESLVKLAKQDDTSSLSTEIVAAFWTRDKVNLNRTCLHAAIQQMLPCVPEMIKLCELVNGRKNNTLDNILKTRKIFAESETRPSSILLMLDNLSPAETPMHTLMGQSSNGYSPYLVARGVGIAPWSTNLYDPLSVISAMEESKGAMAPIWSEVTKGMSPYQRLLDSIAKLKKRLEGTRKDNAMTGRAAVLEKQLKTAQEFERIVNEKLYDWITDIPTLKRALYGTQGEDKELCLDLSDFNHSFHDFSRFVTEFTKQGGGNLFEESLISVVLPDLNSYNKATPYAGVGELMAWLRDKGGVRKIKSMTIPDSTIVPMSEELVDETILSKFIIGRLDWRKLDINLKVVTQSAHASQFTDLVLYSSGNYSILYHWTSADGLGMLLKLRSVTIKIMQLNPKSQPQSAQIRHAENVEKYEKLIIKNMGKLNETREVDKKIRVTIMTSCKWDFPTNYSANQRPNEIEELELVKRLKAWQTTLPALEGDKKYAAAYARFDQLTTKPMTGKGDYSKLIKVAIIDNGADKFREGVRERIVRGISYVKAAPFETSTTTADNSSILPWWMVSDPHGTQMASLITAVNPWVALYIARVGRHRKDILPEDAVKAIQWAVEQEVDIISISWITRTPFSELEKAIKKASKTTLVICSTADEGGWSGPAYPAYYSGTIRVSATDRYGQLRQASDPGGASSNGDGDGGSNGNSRSNRDTYMTMPGEEIPAVGPSYMGEGIARGAVSGSSVATALASGCASLVLLLTRVFDDDGLALSREKLREKGIYEPAQMARLLKRGIRNTNGKWPLCPGNTPEEQAKVAKSWTVESVAKRGGKEDWEVDGS